MLENLLNGQFGKLFWYQEWLPKIIHSCVVSIFVGTPFYFLRFPNVFINFHEYANLIIIMLYRCYVLLLFFIELVL